MADRFNSLTVALDHDIREDDAEALIAAIRQLRGVLAVTGNVVTSSDWVAESRAKEEMRRKIYEALR